ncbi:zinc finger protein 830 [Phymastichus coffea]|uniref:zinc finger protein 830 n=1 Tax=Phymastichus coffea TaxID=108790 RepID=UPI00273CF203|nr:zinc finger protein 830 [Phymastichus coffea]
MAKKISKEELRRAMLEAKKKQGGVKKIESPLARYNELNQLTCVLCKTVIKSETVWPVHLNSKTHKDNVLVIKQTKEKLEATARAPKTHKRQSTTFQEPQPAKKVKGILKNIGNPSTNAKPNLPADFFEKPTSTSNNIPKLMCNGTQKPTNGIIFKTNLTNGLNEKLEMTTEATETKNSKDSTQSTLPEGFFDDPVMDAKARNVEYKDPVEEEWERFQKEIKEETTQSEQIIGEEQESAATERQIDEVEEQMRNWSRVVQMEKLKEQLQSTMKMKDNDDTSSEEDYEEFLDWRTKKS